MISSKTADAIRLALKPTLKERLEQSLVENDKKKVSGLIYGGIILLGVAIVALLIAAYLSLNAIALAYLWGLFVVPIFGLNALTFGNALGLMVIINFIKASVPEDKKVKKDEEVKKTKMDHLATAVKPILIPLGFMAIGWAVHLIMF